MLEVFGLDLLISWILHEVHESVVCTFWGGKVKDYDVEPGISTRNCPNLVLYNCSLFYFEALAFLCLGHYGVLRCGGC